MSRILEFQPTDEQTVIARVLVELHQAIDSNFPGISPTTKQFTKTVLTNQNDTNRNQIPVKSTSTNSNAHPTPLDYPELSKSLSKSQPFLSESMEFKTAGIKTLLGETRRSILIKKILFFTLILGIIALLWMVLFRSDNPFE